MDLGDLHGLPVDLFDVDLHDLPLDLGDLQGLSLSAAACLTTPWSDDKLSLMGSQIDLCYLVSL